MIEWIFEVSRSVNEPPYWRGEVLVPGDLLDVVVDGELIWRDRHSGNHDPEYRSAAARAALMMLAHTNHAADHAADILNIYGRRPS
jgi:hypothetical protein